MLVEGPLNVVEPAHGSVHSVNSVLQVLNARSYSVCLTICVLYSLHILFVFLKQHVEQGRNWQRLGLALFGLLFEYFDLLLQLGVEDESLGETPAISLLFSFEKFKRSFNNV